MVASEKSLEDPVMDVEDIRLVKLCKDVENRVTARCAGLLEVVREPNYGAPNDPYAAQLWDDEDPISKRVRRLAHGTRIKFIHRSARQFLLETDAGKKILSHSSKTNEDCCSDLVRTNIAEEMLDEHSSARPYSHYSSTTPAPETMVLLASFEDTLSEQKEFGLLEMYQKSIQSFSRGSDTFSFLTALYGRYAYAHHCVEQLELQYGRLPTETSALLLHYASSL